jgi:hypothetical protein
MALHRGLTRQQLRDLGFEETPIQMIDRDIRKNGKSYVMTEVATDRGGTDKVVVVTEGEKAGTYDVTPESLF